MVSIRKVNNNIGKAKPLRKLRGFFVFGGLLAVSLAVMAMAVQRVEAIEFVTIAKGHNSGIVDSQNLVIRDDSTWGKLWKMHSRIRLPSPPPPNVDFRQDVVIAAFRGECPTGGYRFQIDKIEKNKDKVIVYLIETRPRRDVMVTQALTQPYHIIRMKRTDLAIEFVYK